MSIAEKKRQTGARGGAGRLNESGNGMELSALLTFFRFGRKPVAPDGRRPVQSQRRPHSAGDITEHARSLPVPPQPQ
jgi:hypothetical protein